MIIPREQAIRFIRETEGKFFSVEFIKRTTGEKRIMNCRTGVKRYLVGENGKGASYNFQEKMLISVYDVEKSGYRSIPIEGITKITVDGEWKEVQ